MMETIRKTHSSSTRSASGTRPSNDDRRRPLPSGRSGISEGAVARIFKPSRSAMTAGSRKSGWRLAFERENAPFIEPLMGYTGSSDMLTQVELEFPTLQSAIRYAERQGLTCVVQRPASKAADPARQRARRRSNHPSHAFSDATLDRLGLATLQQSYGKAMDGAEERKDASGAATWSSPLDVVSDPTLPLEAKRSILMNWAWTEYLLDQATNEGMPENNRPSRLGEVEGALLALERRAENSQARPTADRRAA